VLDNAKLLRQVVMVMKSPLSVVFLILASHAFGSVFDTSIERAPSVSQNYDSRNAFTNPSALAYETELNGPSLLTAFQYGFNVNLRDDLGYSLSYGVLGFGVEQLTAGEGQFSRYGFSLGIPLGTWLFLGARYSFTLSDVAVLNGVNSADLGLQLRPSQYFNLGFLVQGLNQPLAGSANLPMRYILGTTISPLSAVQISADIWTDSSTFAQNFGYVGTLSLEPWKGIKIRGGYHQQYQFFAGLQIDLEHGSLIGTTTPGVSGKPVVAGIQLSSKPYPSALNPSVPLKLEIKPDMVEEPIEPGLFSSEKTSSLEILGLLNKAADDPRVSRIYVKLGSFPQGLASAEEFFEALWAIRERGKMVDVYLQNAGLREYLIASAATSIHIEPSSEIKFLGLRSERYYAKGTLDKIGVEGDFLAKGEYKSAPEMFTRKDSSDPSRRETLSELKAAESEIIKILSKSGRVSRATWNDFLKRGIVGTDTALQLKLVDKVGFYERDIEELHFARKQLTARKTSLAIMPKVAVIVAAGDIMENPPGILSAGGYSTVTPKKLEKAFKRAVSDPSTSAILLRVSSPGGEIGASDEIASLVESARKKKPVYISMGDVAASGGYMIASPGEKIFASPLTITGSIGVFLGKFSLKGLFKMIDLNKEILGDTPYPGLYSEDRGWTDAEKQILGKRLDEYYSGFVSYVARTRSLPIPNVEDAAQGRVWIGSQAMAKRLVDESGGYLEALKATAKKSGLSDGDYETWILKESRGLLGLGDTTEGMGKAAGIGAYLPHSLVNSIKWAESLKRSPFLYWSPFQISSDSSD
jgi:protease IV